MKHLFIINPIAGKRKGNHYAKAIREYFSHLPDSYFIEFTTCPGHATTIAQQYVQSDNYRVYSLGGDGTLNEVLNGLVNSHSSLAVIPLGSGNDFFRSMNETDNDNLLYRTILGQEQWIDIGKVNNQYFLNVASVGIDALAVYYANRLKKFPIFRGMTAYALAALYAFFSYKSIPSNCIIDQSQFHGQTLLFAVANGRYYGGGMKIAPSAQIHDGYFEIYHIDPASILRLLRFFPKLIQGKHGPIKEVSHYRAKEASIWSEEDFFLNIDGETSKVKKANFSIIPDALKLVFPSKEIPKE